VLQFACIEFPSLQALLFSKELAGQQRAKKERERERPVEVMVGFTGK
jgi:hypothetical protein